MPDRSEPTDDAAIGRSLTAPAWIKTAGVALGLALLIAAVVAVMSQRELMSRAWQALRDPSWPLAAVLVGSIAANIALSGLMFSALVSRYGRVGLIEMQALVAVASLLNFLPVRPGMFGRVAYHRGINGIRTVDAAKTVVQGAAISAMVAGALASVAFICSRATWPLWPAVVAGAATLGVLVVIGFVAPRFVHRSAPSSGLDQHGSSGCRKATAGVSSPTLARRSELFLWSAAVLCRYIDVLAWSARYWAVFALIGQPIGFEASVALACIGMIATMTPIGANGMGLREWAIGLVAPFVSAATLRSAVAADLLNRAAELALIAVAGAIGAAVLARLNGRGWRNRLRTASVSERHLNGVARSR